MDVFWDWEECCPKQDNHGDTHHIENKPEPRRNEKCKAIPSDAPRTFMYATPPAIGKFFEQGNHPVFVTSIENHMALNYCGTTAFGRTPFLLEELKRFSNVTADQANDLIA
jgi:hypothetical protein